MVPQRKLSDIANIIAGVHEDKYAPENNSIEYCYIQPNHLLEDGSIQSATTILKKEKIQPNQLVRNGDVLIKRLNHNMALVVSNITKPTIVSINLFIIRPNKEVVPEYLACLLERAGVLSQIEHISGTSASIKAISAKKLADVRIPIIPIEKQKALGQIWYLTKQKKKLLQNYMQESENFLSAIVDKLITAKQEER